MQLEDLLVLLPHGENVDLDWKRNFPLGYFDKTNPRYTEARAEMVKDVAAMANAASEKVGHLVYGIADQNGDRRVWPEVRTQPVDDAILAQFLARYLDPVPIVEYDEFQYEGQLVGLLRVHRAMPYPHVVRESLGGAIHKGQVYVRKGTHTEIALYADLIHMMEGRHPMVLPISTPEADEISIKLQSQGWRVGWILDREKDVRLFAGAERVYFPSTRRYIVAPTGNPAGMPLEQFLMRWKPEQVD